MHVDFFLLVKMCFTQRFMHINFLQKNITRVLVETEPALVFFISIEEVVLTQALCT